MATVTLFTNLETTSSKLSLPFSKEIRLSLTFVVDFFKQRKIGNLENTSTTIENKNNVDKEIPKPLAYGAWYEIYKERNRLEFALDSIYAPNLHNLPFEAKDNQNKLN